MRSSLTSRAVTGVEDHAGLIAVSPQALTDQ
jgi:hypothetical protein